MKTTMRWSLLGALLTGVTLGSTGCQTYQVGQVLPTPYHIRDDVQYFPKGPDFPLANELNAMRAAEAANAPLP